MATALIRPLAREPPYAAEAALEKAKKKKGGGGTTPAHGGLPLTNCIRIAQE